MNNKDIVDFIEKLNIYKTKVYTYLKNHNIEILECILENTKFLDDTNEKHVDISFQERLYCIRNNISKRPICIECGEYTYFRKDENRFREFCSSKCSKSSKQTKEKREKTNEQLYGNKNFNNIDKSKNTRYNNNNGKWHGSDFVSKTKETLLKEHGDPNWNNKEKSSQTCKKLYGVENPLQSSKIQEKCRESFRINHPGMKSTMDIPGVSEKLRVGTRIRSWNFIINNSLVEPMFSKEEYVKCKDPSKEKFTFKCRKCGNKFESTWNNGSARLCEICHPGLKGTSESELELFEFVKGIVKSGWNVYNRNDINRNIISPKEIDIVVCDDRNNIRLFIEYDGLFFHSDDTTVGKDRNYHIDKTTACEKLGYRLIHVFENEWLSQREIVKSRLKNMLGIYDNVVYARECETIECDKNETDEFLIRNHIQGTCNSSVNIGLSHNGKVVAIMTFGKSRFNRKYEWELLRFCSEKGYHVIGGAGKCLKFFERIHNPKSIISYADRRWSIGNLYDKLGFTLDHSSGPNYWYFKPNNTSIIFNRMKFQKSRLKCILDSFDDGKTEIQNMYDNGYRRIFDCGNLVYVKTY